MNQREPMVNSTVELRRCVAEDSKQVATIADVVCFRIPIVEYLVARLDGGLVAIGQFYKRGSHAPALGDVSRDTHHFDGAITVVNKPRAHIKRDSFAVFRQDVQFIS